MLRTVLLGLLLAGGYRGRCREHLQVGRWSGQIYYTDLPPLSRTPGAAVYERSLITDENGEPVQRTSLHRLPNHRSRVWRAAVPATVAAVQADLNEARTRLCKEAQAATSLHQSQRLFCRGADGQRQYLAMRNWPGPGPIKQAVDEYCSPALEPRPGAAIVTPIVGFIGLGAMGQHGPQPA